MIQREDIMYRCAPLVDFSPFTTAATSGGFLSLSHGSVFEFILDTPNESRHDRSREPLWVSSTSPSPPLSGAAADEDKAVVDKDLIAKACLKYLSQRRYSKPLRRLSPVHFQTATTPSNNVEQHHFLQYAAKYWYRHLEGTRSCTRSCADIKALLQSPQLITASQTQSLFVVGHFIHSLDQNKEIGPGFTNHNRVMKRNLPEWFRASDEDQSMVAEYETFFSEWSAFLQLGVTDFLNGEIDRCLW